MSTYISLKNRRTDKPKNENILSSQLILIQYENFSLFKEHKYQTGSFI